MAREEEIRARLENIVPGGWARATPMAEGYPTEIWHAIDNTTICRLAKTEDEYVNADFIYMAPEDIDYLLKENQRLRDALAAIPNMPWSMVNAHIRQALEGRTDAVQNHE